MPTKKNTLKKSKPKAKKKPHNLTINWKFVENKNDDVTHERQQPIHTANETSKKKITQRIELPVEIELPTEEPPTKIFVLGFIVGLFFGGSGMLIFIRLMG